MPDIFNKEHFLSVQRLKIKKIKIIIIIILKLKRRYIFSLLLKTNFIHLLFLTIEVRDVTVSQYGSLNVDFFFFNLLLSSSFLYLCIFFT